MRRIVQKAVIKVIVPPAVRRIVQKAVIKVIVPQVVEYTCDKCGSVCGTRANPKETWYGKGHEYHYCKRTCTRSSPL